MNRPETAKATTKPKGEVRPVVAQAEKESSYVELLEKILTRDNLLDRVIQQAIAQILSPIYDPTFSESSHGFRPMRSAHDAIQSVQQKSKVERRKWLVDCDLKAYLRYRQS